MSGSLDVRLSFRTFSQTARLRTFACKETREAVAGVVANMLEKGRTPPLPSSGNKRDEQP